MSSVSLLDTTVERGVWVGRVRDYLELTKPRIAVLVLVTVAVGAGVASWSWPNPSTLWHALIGTALVAASASTFNQLIERRRDEQMQRTADRPLVAGRLSTADAAIFGTLTIVVGLIYLAVTLNPLTTQLAALTWVLYVVVYTPLKVVTPLNTVVGAVAGALPVWIGWTAAGGQIDVPATALFLIVYLWQFPHFMAIAWLYREDYARAGMRMLPVVDPSGRRAGRQAVGAALALLPVSLVPGVWQWAGPGLAIWSALWGLGYLAAAIGFAVDCDRTTARRLLRMSLLYLPAVMLPLVLIGWF